MPGTCWRFKDIWGANFFRSWGARKVLSAQGKFISGLPISLFFLVVSHLKQRWYVDSKCNTWGAKGRCNSTVKNYPSAHPWTWRLGSMLQVWHGADLGREHEREDLGLRLNLSNSAFKNYVGNFLHIFNTLARYLNKKNLFACCPLSQLVFWLS